MRRLLTKLSIASGAVVLGLCSGIVAAQVSSKPAAAATTRPATQTSHPFELVMVDSASEAKLGAFPIDRKYIARAVDTLKAAKARGIVLKFFYDQPGKSAESDQRLANAIASAGVAETKVALQARLDDDEVKSNPLPARFIAEKVTGDFRKSITGTGGWIPIPVLANVAHDVGFVDVTTPERVPAIENFQGRPVKSLTLIALEMATGQKAVVESNVQVTLGKLSLLLDRDNQIKLRPLSESNEKPVSFIDLLDGKIDAARFRDKVVVIGYDGSKMHSLKTTSGEIKAHRLFYLGLVDAFNQLQ